MSALKLKTLEIPDQGVLKEIKEVLPAQSYVECGVCGAIKVDAMELARVLHLLSEKYFDEEKENEKSETFNEIMWKIIECAPDIDNSDYLHWFEENESRLCKFLEANDYGSQIYVKYDEVLFFSDKNCECLIAWKRLLQ